MFSFFVASFDFLFFLENGWIKLIFPRREPPMPSTKGIDLSRFEYSQSTISHSSHTKVPSIEKENIFTKKERFWYPYLLPSIYYRQKN